MIVVEKTYVIKGKPEKQWILLDANGKNLGRLATEIVRYLLGKHKPTFTPGVDMGDFVVIVNADKLEFTQKRLEEKFYNRHSGYPSGLKSYRLQEMLVRHPENVIQYAVWGMLPHNRMGKKILKRLKIYTSNEHPHEAQKPQSVA
jgi:large subunit ribosomal protein L13